MNREELKRKAWQDGLTQDEVYQYFATSDDPFQREIAKDIKASYGIGTLAAPRQPISDLSAVVFHLSHIVGKNGQWKRGANATIAELVFGDRTKTGGAYNRKIQEIKGDILRLINATTTPIETLPPAEVVAMAA